MTAAHLKRFAVEIAFTNDVGYLEALREGFEQALVNERNERVADEMRLARQAIDDRITELELDRRDED